MKQLKFLINVDLENIPIWFKDIIYTVSKETENSYILMCEDMKMRGIDKQLER